MVRLTALKYMHLSQICDIEMGATPDRANLSYWQGTNVWVSIADITALENKTISDSKEKITNLGVNNSSSYLVKPGTIILSFKLSLGKRAIARVPLYTNEAIAALPIKNKDLVDSLYLYYALEAINWDKFARRAVKGKTINKETLSKVPIAVPPLNKQRYIASILEEADHTRLLRRYTSQIGDTFLQSVFIEMFGDPVANLKEWKTKSLKEIASVNRGKFTPRPRNNPRYYNGNYPFIQTGDIAKSNGTLTDHSQTLNEEGIAVSRAFPSGTIVIAIVGATIGETAILGKKMYCPDSIIGINVDLQKTTTEYVEHLLRFWKPIFHQKAPQTARANINLETLRPLPIIMPPLSMQQTFSSIVNDYQTMEKQQRESAHQSEHLFQTLLHQAFTGEL